MSTLDLSLSSQDGIALPSDSRALSYLYGLSDFWIYMFQDESLLNTYLGATAVLHSDLYNEFLQRALGISLATVQEYFNYQITLIVVPVATSGAQNTTPLTEALISAKYLSNSPLAPSIILERDVDFFIDTRAGALNFAKPISSYGFGVQSTATGLDYAMWATDAVIDEGALLDYAKLANVTLSNPVLSYKGFLQGLYYVYINGPVLDLVRQGLNLALGIPSARGNETVLNLSQSQVDNNWIVTTDASSYEIPYGLPPSVTVGQQLTTLSPLANWVEVEDVESKPGWWINLQIPANLLKTVPTGHSAYATPGSYADWVMTNYLSRHTFLVNVVTTGFENVQMFSDVIDILQTVKPKYTTSIYIWSVPVTETIVMTDTQTRSVGGEFCEKLSNDIESFNRNSFSPVLRNGCIKLTRFCVPERYQDSLATTSPNLQDSVPALNLTYEGTDSLTRMNFGAGNLPVEDYVGFAVGDGTTGVFTLPPGAVTPTDLKLVDWQGISQLYSTPRTNYVVPSTNLGNTSSWSTTDLAPGVVITTNAGTAPDGSNTAVMATQTVGYQLVREWVNIQPTAALWCGSMFVKAGTTPSMTFNVYNNSYSQPEANIDYVFATNTFTNIVSSVLGYGSQYIGNGWYRIWMCVQDPTATSLSIGFRFWPASRNTTDIGYTYVWGPQLEIVQSVTQGPSRYLPTATSSITVTDYTQAAEVVTLSAPAPLPSSVLQAKCLVTGASQRKTQNLLGYTSTFSSGWYLANGMLNAGTAPDGSNTAVLVTIPSGGASWVTPSYAILYATPVNTYYTYSCFFKAGSTSQVTLLVGGQNNPDVHVYADLSAGKILGTFGAVMSCGISNAGQGWFRVWATYLLPSAPSAYYFLGAYSVNGTEWSSSLPSEVSFYAWGPQLELGVEPSPYYPVSAAPGSDSGGVSYSNGLYLVSTKSVNAPVDTFPVNTTAIGSNNLTTFTPTAPGNTYTSSPWNYTLPATYRSALFNRTGQYLPQRNSMTWGRGVEPVGVSASFPTVSLDARVLYLYTTSTRALTDKMEALGRTIPNNWYFLITTQTYSETINEYAIDVSAGQTNSLEIFQRNFDTLFVPTPGDSLPQIFGEQSLKYYPLNPNSLTPNDYLMFIQITSEAWGCYWVTTLDNLVEEGWPYAIVKPKDSFSITQTGNPTRGSGPLTRAPFYLSRGLGTISTGGIQEAIDLLPLNAPQPVIPAVGSTYYQDYSNSDVLVSRTMTLTENATY